MHNDEIWQTYHPNGEPVFGGGWEARLGNPEVSRAEAIVGVTVVILFRKNEAGEIELLWQRRSEKVDRYPGDYDFSAGGHINLGESLTEAAVREADEEIGVSIRAEDLNFVAMRPFNKNRFCWIYVVDYTGREEEFSFNDEEVSEVRWVLLREVDEFKEKYAKEPLKKEELTFECLREWFSQHDGAGLYNV